MTPEIVAATLSVCLAVCCWSKFSYAYRKGYNQGASDRGKLPCDAPECPLRNEP